MLTSFFTLVVALTTALMSAASEKTPSMRFSWKSRLPSRVRAMTAQNIFQDEHHKMGLKDVGVRVAEYVEGQALSKLVSPISRKFAKVSPPSVVRLDLNKASAATTYSTESSANATPSTDKKLKEADPSSPYWATILHSSEKDSYNTVDKEEIRKEIPNSVKFVYEYVHIGQNKISKERVTPIGDIDGNGFMDYIVATPFANKNRGSIRLYLMKEKDGFLFSRELVPGKWGFSGPPLSKDDEFGSKVLKLPSESGKKPCVLVVGAPGDNASRKKKGAVYILEVSKYGSVAKNIKVSSDTDNSLALQLDDNEGFGADLELKSAFNSDGEAELAVGSALGSTTTLFMDSDYNVKTGLKLHNSENAAIAGAIRKTVRALSSKLDVGGLYPSMIHNSVTSRCFFNETHCACGLKNPGNGSVSCLDVVDTDPGTGKARCIPSDCGTSYLCTCDGERLCKRVDTVEQVWTPVEDAGSGLVFCEKKNVTSSVNEVQTGAGIPYGETTVRLSTFNATHCRCSPKRELVAPYQCLDFLRTEDEVAVLCTSRDCSVRTDEYACDGIGTSYCERKYVERMHFVNNGIHKSEPGVVYCHQVSSLAEKVTPVQLNANAESD